ncbi:hypothetical protein GOP47_0011369 [Adiantum capillus-veneris]|uniref:protein-serine/threonine phosphatase n=1 Tax=Adiantum capillus-veneris TaxID=13818 RepID=A0A9D4UST7_ADICA|nr:hypothetical protein GOP47_0011369 [Adiantum capillus-veneris]
MISNNGHAHSSVEPARSKGGVLKKLKIATGLQSSSPAHSGRGRSKGSSRIAYGFSLAKGKANHPMEDYHFAEFQCIHNQEIGLFAIFDGHLGHDVPSYLQSNLFENIIGQPEFWKNPRAATFKAYGTTDKTILRKAPELGFGGSTAVTAILMKDGRLQVANVGDSRAVLCKSGHAVQLSVDHEPKDERKMIERKGGFVTMLPGDVPRVDGQLAVARAFGDKNLKAHLSCEPDIVDVVLDASDENLILASDGLWKVMENQEAVDLIRKVKDPESAAKMLVEAALLRKSRDDISCIVVRLR